MHIITTMYLHNYLKYYNEFASITIYVDNPTILGTTEILKVSDKVREEEWYKNAISNSGKIAWRYTTDELTQLQYLSLVRCIKDSSGKQIGVLVISINTSILKKIIDSDSINNIILLDGHTISLENGYEIDEEELLKHTIKSSRR